MAPKLTQVSTLLTLAPQETPRGFLIRGGEMRVQMEISRHELPELFPKETRVVYGKFYPKEEVFQTKIVPFWEQLAAEKLTQVGPLAAVFSGWGVKSIEFIVLDEAMVERGHHGYTSHPSNVIIK